MKEIAGYVKCATCSRIIDLDTEAVAHKGKHYCFDHYEDLITEEQNEELDDDTKAQKICGFYDPQKIDFCGNPRTFCLECSKNKCSFKKGINNES